MVLSRSLGEKKKCNVRIDKNLECMYIIRSSDKMGMHAKNHCMIIGIHQLGELTLSPKGMQCRYIRN